MALVRGERGRGMNGREEVVRKRRVRAVRLTCIEHGAHASLGGPEPCFVLLSSLVPCPLLHGLGVRRSTNPFERASQHIGLPGIACTAWFSVAQRAAASTDFPLIRCPPHRSGQGLRTARGSVPCDAQASERGWREGRPDQVRRLHGSPRGQRAQEHRVRIRNHDVVLDVLQGLL